MPDESVIISNEGEVVLIISTENETVIVSEVPGFNGGDTTYAEGKGPVLTWPDGSQARIIAIVDQLGNKTIDFEEVP